MGRERLRKRPSAHARSLRLLRCKQKNSRHDVTFLSQKAAEVNVGLIHLLSCQATYDPSHGYSPQPIDISGMALSRELQVSLFLTLTQQRIADQSFFSRNIPLKYCVLPCSQWLSSWLRTITTPGAGRRSWSSKPRVRVSVHVD